VPRLQQSGLDIDLPPGWEGRIFTRSAEPVVARVPEGSATDSSAERTLPILHVANFGLPGEVGDFGGGAVELMRTGHAFVSLVDYGADAAGTPLFSSAQVPLPLRTDQFDPDTLQRPLPGQSGVQRFFTASGRGFCLYVVLGAHLFRARVVPAVNDALRSLRIS
jgi:hypothetical protein